FISHTAPHRTRSTYPRDLALCARGAHLCKTLLLLASESPSECVESSRRAGSDNRQRLLRTIERRFPRPNLSRRRSRCDSIVCQDWMLSNLTVSTRKSCERACRQPTWRFAVA